MNLQQKLESCLAVVLNRWNMPELPGELIKKRLSEVLEHELATGAQWHTQPNGLGNALYTIQEAESQTIKEMVVSDVFAADVLSMIQDLVAIAQANKCRGVYLEFHSHQPFEELLPALQRQGWYTYAVIIEGCTQATPKPVDIPPQIQVDHSAPHTEYVADRLAQATLAGHPDPEILTQTTIAHLKQHLFLDYQQRLHDQNLLACVAIHERTCVGHATIDLEVYDRYTGQQVPHLLDIYVEPEFHNLGIAHTLEQHIGSTVHSLGFNTWTGSVFTLTSQHILEHLQEAGWEIKRHLLYCPLQKNFKQNDPLTAQENP